MVPALKLGTTVIVMGLKISEHVFPFDDTTILRLKWVVCVKLGGVYST